MERKRWAFTIVELLTVLAIIAILVGLLIPSIAMVRRIAKETKQRAQFAAIDMAILAFKSDYGNYPPSGWDPVTQLEYCGAQKLCEALLGWDLMGFHPDSAWQYDGFDKDVGPETYDPGKVRNYGYASLEERRPRYLELSTANAFELSPLFDGVTAPLDPNTFVLCDSFTVKRVRIGQKIVKAGTPILYYRADTSSKTIHPSVRVNERIYNAEDNLPLVDLKTMVDGEEHELLKDAPNYEIFYKYIEDPRVSNIIPWPHRPDSYILISAGADGEYGTSDDIRNF